MVHLALNIITIYTENFNFVMRVIWYNGSLVSLLALNLLFLVSDDQYNDKYSYQNYLGIKVPMNKLSPTANPMVKDLLSSYPVDYYTPFC